MIEVGERICSKMEWWRVGSFKKYIETSFDIYKKTVIDMILVPDSEILWSRGRNFPVTGQQSWKSVGATQSEFIYLYRK